MGKFTFSSSIYLQLLASPTPNQINPNKIGGRKERKYTKSIYTQTKIWGSKGTIEMNFFKRNEGISIKIKKQKIKRSHSTKCICISAYVFWNTFHTVNLDLLVQHRSIVPAAYNLNFSRKSYSFFFNEKINLEK